MIHSRHARVSARYFTVIDARRRLWKSPLARFGVRIAESRVCFQTEMLKSAKRFFLERMRRTGGAAFARAQTPGTMRTKQMRRAGAAGTRPKVHEMPYVNPLHLIGACRAAIDVSRRANNDRPVHFFRAEARRRDARRAAVRGRATRSRAADALRACVAESSATSSAPARGDAREHTPIARRFVPRGKKMQNIFIRGNPISSSAKSAARKRRLSNQSRPF